MNLSIRKVAAVLAVLLIAIFASLNFVQVVKGDDYRNHVGNKRVHLAEYSSPRGQIVVQGSAIASSAKSNDELKYQRHYASGPQYAPVTGYYSFDYGASGLELAEDEVLSGNDPRLFGSRLSDLLTGRDPMGGNIELTLNKEAQTAAYNALAEAGARGSVVALDPTTGAILAAVSTPSFDPNQLASHNRRTADHAYACYLGLSHYTVDNETEEQAHLRRQAGLGVDKIDEMAVAAQLTMRRDGVSGYRAQIKGDKPAKLGNAAERAQQAKYEIEAAFADTYYGLGAKGCGDVPNDPTAMYAADQDSRLEAGGPLVNRAFSQTYHAGSTFKIIVAAAALKAGAVKTNQKIAAPNGYYPATDQAAKSCTNSSTGKQDAGCIENIDGEVCQDGSTATLEFAFAKSCNTAFAALAVQYLDGATISQQASAFGFDSADPLTVPLSVTGSTVGSADELAEDGSLAHIAIGQQSVEVTPLQDAMLSAAVANDGALMTPYLVRKELGPNLSLLKETTPTQLSTPLEPAVAAELKQMMHSVVYDSEGTAHGAKVTSVPDVEVYGKTGTADTGPSSYAEGYEATKWFTGFAEQGGNPKIALAVVIENSSELKLGGAVTEPSQAANQVAKAVIEAYLRAAGGD